MDSTERTLIEGEDDGFSPRDWVQAEDQLWVLLECDRPLALSSRHSLRGLESVAIGRAAERGLVRRADGGEPSELGLPDRWMSTKHARLIRSGRAWQLQDAGSTNGTRVNGQHVTQRQLVRTQAFDQLVGLGLHDPSQRDIADRLNARLNAQ